MCGRYTLETDLDALQLRFNFTAEGISRPPQYNIAPTQGVLAVVSPDGETHGEMLRWGLIPSWAKNPSVGHRMINARAETVAEKPGFRRALLKRRCLILADGFYEWRREGKNRVPFRFILENREPFAFAGLWELWKSPSGEWIKSCAIVTTSANGLVAPIHNRMPVILPQEAESLWLDHNITDPGVPTSLFAPYPSQLMNVYQVSPVVNSPKHNDPTCIEPAPKSIGLF